MLLATYKLVQSTQTQPNRGGENKTKQNKTEGEESGTQHWLQVPYSSRLSLDT